MNKTFKILAIVVLGAIILLSLPFLYVSINALLFGSFEWYPTPEQMEKARLGGFVGTAIALFVDILAGVGLTKLIKSMRIK